MRRARDLTGLRLLDMPGRWAIEHWDVTTAGAARELVAFSVRARDQILRLADPDPPYAAGATDSLQLQRRTRAERRARTGDLLQITKALLTLEK